jgi:hypothetical protein
MVGWLACFSAEVWPGCFGKCLFRQSLVNQTNVP